MDLLERYEEGYTNLEDHMISLREYQHHENFRYLVGSVGLEKIKAWTKELEKECQEDVALSKRFDW